VESLVIADPYLLASATGRERVAEFVASLWTLTEGSITKVTLRWQRGKPNDQGKGLAPQFEAEARTQFRKYLKSRKVPDTLEIGFIPVPLQPNADFHDRRVMASVRVGTELRKMRWDVSAGINNLLDPNKECTVTFVSK
jgi:hypothetical protein